jgi:repressor LexA
MTLDWLNENDKRVYALIRNKLVHGIGTPTLKEINEILGKSSLRSAVLSLDRLEKAGLITRGTGNKIRLTRGAVNENSSITTLDVPLIGQVAAGNPILTKENIEAMIPVSIAFARPGNKYFLLRIVGNSMNLAKVRGANIEDKSIVLIKQQNHADEGDIAVALINDSATVKFFHYVPGAVVLKPRSTETEHRPIILTENCLIQGVVIAVLPSDIY